MIPYNQSKDNTLRRIYFMRRDIKTTEAIFPMPVLMIATYNEDGSIDVMNAAWGNDARKGLYHSESH